MVSPPKSSSKPKILPQLSSSKIPASRLLRAPFNIRGYPCVYSQLPPAIVFEMVENRAGIAYLGLEPKWMKTREGR